MLSRFNLAPLTRNVRLIHPFSDFCHIFSFYFALRLGARFILVLIFSFLSSRLYKIKLSTRGKRDLRSKPQVKRAYDVETLNCPSSRHAFKSNKMKGKDDVYLVLGQLILLIALADGGRPNARYNWIFFIPIIIISIYFVFFFDSHSAHIFIFVSLIPTASDFILLRNRQPELRKIGQHKTTSTMTFTERLVWAASLIATPRGIGWAHEPIDHIPKQPTSSRTKFIASQMLWIVFYFTVFNVIAILAQENPCFRAGGPSLTAFGWWWRTTSWLFVFSLYYTMNGLYAALSIVYVATGLYKPADCPHLFGSPLQAYTLRKCWG